MPSDKFDDHPAHSEAAPLPELNVLLTPGDVQRLRASGEDPEEYTVLTLLAARVQSSQPLPDGRIVLMPHFVLPPGLLQPVSAFHAVNRRGNALDKAIGVMPEARLIVRIDRLMPEAKAQLQEETAQMLAQLRSAPGTAEAT